MDIAELRGSEDLWEVARIHNRESSFPVVLLKLQLYCQQYFNHISDFYLKHTISLQQLLDAQYLPSNKMCDWFGSNTKRPELLKDLSRSFFDLVDKCLTVNPRLRISAEAALKHEFFASCHEQLKQQRQRRRSKPQTLQANSS